VQTNKKAIFVPIFKANYLEARHGAN
jgi:hypothetical protein